MELRTAASPRDVKNYDTDRLREEFLIEKVFKEDEIYLVYSHIDRIITGSAMPVNKELKLEAGDELRAEYFLERREMGVINIGMSIMGVDQNRCNNNRRQKIQCGSQRGYVCRTRFQGDFFCE